MAETIYDVVVIGGGPAGYTCAIRASQYGLKAALIDANDVAVGIERQQSFVQRLEYGGHELLVDRHIQPDSRVAADLPRARDGNVISPPFHSLEI